MIYYLDTALLILRAAIGILFLPHGWPKLKNLKQTAGFAASIGFKPGWFWGFMLAFAEFFGALALISGFATRIGAGLLLLSMLVATYHNIFVWKKKFAGGWELDFILLAALAAVLLIGAGAYSIDGLIGWRL